jgi:hypothetical protein
LGAAYDTDQDTETITHAAHRSRLLNQGDSVKALFSGVCCSVDSQNVVAVGRERSNLGLLLAVTHAIDGNTDREDLLPSAHQVPNRIPWNIENHEP